MHALARWGRLGEGAGVEQETRPWSAQTGSRRGGVTDVPRAEVDVGLSTPCPQRLSGSGGPAPWTRRGQPRRHRAMGGRPDAVDADPTSSAEVCSFQLPEVRSFWTAIDIGTFCGTSERTAHTGQQNIAQFIVSRPSKGLGTEHRPFAWNLYAILDSTPSGFPTLALGNIALFIRSPTNNRRSAPPRDGRRAHGGNAKGSKRRRHPAHGPGGHFAGQPDSSGLPPALKRAMFRSVKRHE